MWSCGNPIKSLWRRISLEFLVEVSAATIECIRRAGSSQHLQFRGMQSVTLYHELAGPRLTTTSDALREHSDVSRDLRLL